MRASYQSAARHFRGGAGDKRLRGGLATLWQNPTREHLMITRVLPLAIAAGLFAAGCSSPSATAQNPPPKAAAKAKLGIRAKGDTEIEPDLTKIPNADLKKVYSYIDEHIDDHVENLQKWIRQPSISNSGEGIPESAEMVKGFFEQLGLPDRAGLRRRHHRMGRARQSGRLRQVRLRCAADHRDLLAVRHDAGDAARCVAAAAVRSQSDRTGTL